MWSEGLAPPPGYVEAHLEEECDAVADAFLALSRRIGLDDECGRTYMLVPLMRVKQLRVLLERQHTFDR